MLMTSSTATRGRGGRGGRKGRGGGGTGWDRGRRRGEARNHRVPITATDHSRGGVPPSRSPRLTVMGDLRRMGTRQTCHQLHTDPLPEYRQSTNGSK